LASDDPFAARIGAAGDQTAEVVSIQLDDKTVVYAEARVADPDRQVADSVFDLGGVTAAIRGVAGELASTLRAISPDETELEVGVELAIKEGGLVAVLVRGSATASLKIRLKWAAGSEPEAIDGG
jgi:NTP-dependent ternary system trypsin peptidase co-occuring protein